MSQSHQIRHSRTRLISVAFLVASLFATGTAGAKECSGDRLPQKARRDFLRSQFQLDKDLVRFLAYQQSPEGDICRGFTVPSYPDIAELSVISFTAGRANFPVLLTWDARAEFDLKATLFANTKFIFGDNEGRSPYPHSQFWQAPRNGEAYRESDRLFEYRIDFASTAEGRMPLDHLVESFNLIPFALFPETHFHLLAEDTSGDIIPVTVDRASRHYYFHFRGDHRIESVNVGIYSPSEELVFQDKPALKSAAGAVPLAEYSVAIPFPKKRGTYTIEISLRYNRFSVEHAYYRFIHFSDSTREAAEAPEPTYSERVRSAIEVAQNSFFSILDDIDMYRDQEGSEYYKKDAIVHAMAAAMGRVFSFLDTSRATALRDYIRQEVAGVASHLEIVNISDDTVVSVTRLTRRSSSFRLVSVQSSDYVTKTSAIKSLSVLGELLEALAAMADEPVLDLCVRTHPPGAEFYLRPVSVPVGAQRLATTALFGGVARGIYRYEIRKSGYKPVSFEDLNLVRTTGNRLDCDLIEATSQDEPLPCQIVAGPELCQH